MDIKDNLVGLYIKQFVMPKALIFDKPGFVSFKISGKTNVFARQILMPEDFFVKLEKQIVEKYGDNGRSALYSTGKKFGYSFAQLGRFENINDHPGEGVKNWITIASKFIEGTYASQMLATADIEKKTVDCVLKNFAICRKLGYDFFFATGGAAGVIAWLLQDKNIEGYYYDNQFSGEDHICKVKCAPFEVIKAIDPKNVFREIDLDNLKQDVVLYNKFNAEVQLDSTKSFSSYLDAKIFSYEKGVIQLKPNNERFFLMEASGMYLLEVELRKKHMDDDIFDVAYTVGKELFGGLSSDVQSSSELMIALGCGEIIVLPRGKNAIRVIINHFPWTSWYKEVDFVVIRGFLSGIYSKIYKRDIKLGKPQVDMHDNHLALVLSEVLE